MARTLYPILVVAALGTASLIWGLSGFGAVFMDDDPVNAGENAASDLEGEADDSVASDEGDFNASARSGTEDNIVGVILSGIQGIVGFVTMAALLPVELRRIGFPYYFAYPVGILIQAIVGIGFIQFATGRNYR